MDMWTETRIDVSTWLWSGTHRIYWVRMSCNQDWRGRKGAHTMSKERDDVEYRVESGTEKEINVDL